MSNYLVNIARRAVGVAPVARPRLGPPAGIVPPVVLGLGQPLAPPSPTPNSASALIAPESPARLEAVGNAPAPAVSTPPASIAPRPADEASAAFVQPPLQAPVLQSGRPSSRAALESPHLAGFDGRPPRVEARIDPVRGRPTAKPMPLTAYQGRSPKPISLTTRQTDAPTEAGPSSVVEPAAAVTSAALPRTVMEHDASAREVQVRIGSIEIYAEQATASPLTVPQAAAPAAAVAQGGFDAFVRLRTYAPWER